MNDIIIHISDLHITDASGTFGPVNEHTILRSDDSDVNFALFNSIIEKVKRINCKNRYLVITGDVVNIAEKIEFDTIEPLIKLLINKLGITSDHILLVPGDHEIHRDSIKNSLREEANRGKKGYTLNESKYINFFSFYKNIKGLPFDSNKIIFDQIIIGKILLLGVNSNYKVGQDSSDGFIPLQKFDDELSEILNKHADKQIILAVHHNISGSYQNTRTGQWIEKNRKDLIPIFEKYNVKCILHGNEHTPKSEMLDSTRIFVSDSGALAGKEPLGSFKVYEIDQSIDSISLINNIYQLRKVNAVTEPTAGEWTTIQAEEVSVELKCFDLFKKEPEPIDQLIEIPAISALNENKAQKKNELKTKRIFYDNKIIQEQLYSIIRIRKLFHSGHFHWSESSRAHNWIDIAKLIEEKNDLIFVKNAIVDLINELKLYDDCKLLISLGTEGNIISSKATIKFNIPHTFLPYSYRYDESHEYSRKLNFDNSTGDFNNVIIITDVVNDGRTIRKLINEKEFGFFSKVEKIIVISLFYTGQQDIDTGVLNYNNLPSDHNFEDEYKVNNIEYYTVFSLKVEKCPYGKDYRKECFIYRDELSCVHIFYDEDKYKNNQRDAQIEETRKGK